MYPQRELDRLAAHKAALRRDIAQCREDCQDAAVRVAKPIEWLYRALAFWRKLSPYAKFAAVPLGFLIKRKVLPRRKIIGSLLRWAPLVFQVARGFHSATKQPVSSAHSSNGRG